MSGKIPKSHPRYSSLVTRERLVEASEQGIVAWQGLLAHGRGEAFDYLLGEESVPEAIEAERAGASRLLSARRGAISVNGNVAVLAADAVRRLAEATGAVVEVNLFHRTEDRVKKIIQLLQETGLSTVLGTEPDALIPGLDHPRSLCCREGIYTADVVLVPLEDGDRAEALVGMGKTVISIDLNPLSRTSKAATIAIVDEVTRALENMARFAEELKDDTNAIRRAEECYEKRGNLAGIMEKIRGNLEASEG